ncbi:MAG: hypothetical protein HN750_15720 [Gemmatimonadales bacterium]|jgi:hypothetical protein|nr:hypothetical protein [Gemmatimonadales bacterium]
MERPNTQEDLDAIAADVELQQLEIMRVMEPLVKEGEGWLIGKDEDGITAVLTDADDEKRSILQQTQPRLYGTLLSANDRVNDSFGCGLMSIALFSVVLPCLGLHWQLFHHFTTDVETQRFLEGLRSWWVYSLFAFGAFTFWIKVNGVIEGMAYQGERHDISGEASRCGFDKLQILAAIEGDSSVSVISKQLKLDRGTLG